VSVNEVLEAVRTMSPEERERVRALLNALPDATSSAEDVAQARLHEAGLLGETRTRVASIRARRSLVEIKGKSLSETIIEERG